MIKMLVFDVDGTLYDLNRHEIPRSCQEAIAKAKRSGLIFVIEFINHVLQQIFPESFSAYNDNK